MQEFWSRWHTSLGWWFTEFVARPLGGANRGKVREVLNVLIIFSLVGLWHGAAWTFVLWGLFNGVLVAFWRQRPTPAGRHPMKLAPRDIGPIVGTFLLFVTGGILFRASSFENAKDVAERVLSNHNGLMPDDWQLIPIMLAVVFVLDYAERRRRIRAIEQTRTRARLGTAATFAEAPYESIIENRSSLNGGVLIGALAVGILLFSGGAPVPFIYFNF